MENITDRKTEISKVFIWFGVVVLIISMIDIFDILFPLRLSSPEWVFVTTQGIVTSILAPALAIILILAGFYINKNSVTNKKGLIFEQILSFGSFILMLCIAGNLLIYSLSIKAYETNAVSSIKSQKESALSKLEEIKNSGQINVAEEVFEQKIAEINRAASQQIESTKKQILKRNIKVIVEMILYILLYLMIGKIAYQSSRSNLLKLKFVNKQ